jgi:hypothetical protein
VFLAYGVLKTNEDTSNLRVRVLPQASFRSQLHRGISHPPKVGLLLLQLLMLCLLDGVKSLAWHTLPFPSGLSVLVHNLLYIANLDVELSHLLSEGNPTKRRVQLGRRRHRISVGSTSRHFPLATTCASPSRATRTLLVHGLIPTGSISKCKPRPALGRGPCARRRCGRLRLWLRRRLQRWLWW